MTNVLVAGGAGYIGSHACKVLKQTGYTPICFDNLETGWADAVKFGPLVIGDLRNRDAIDQVFKDFPISAVMHFAAYSQVGESMTDPAKYWHNNVVGALNLAEAAIEAGCLNFVFSSTCATYGEHDNVVLDETTSQHPLNAYGASKKAVEDILNNFKESHGLNSVIFRYFNVAGADPDAEIGEFHQPETHLIPIILDVIAGKRSELTIYGTDYKTPDGTCIRDYVHVMDLVDAHVAGVRWLEAGKGSKVFNLGTGTGFSVREIIDHAQRITNANIPLHEGQRRPGDCTKLVSGSTRAEADLGWKPYRSTPAQMIEDAWRWHQTGLYTK